MITIDNGIGKKRLNDFNLRALQSHVYPMTAEINHLTNKIPRMVGLYRFGQEINAKQYAIPVRMVENDESFAMEQLNKLSLFLFDGNYLARPLKIIFDSEPDKYINAFASGSLQVSRDFIVSEFDLTFVAVDPRKYSVVYNDELTWGNEIITFNSFYLLSHENVSAETHISGATTLAVSVIGLSLRPTIEISGSATNLVITANGKAIPVGTFTNTTWIIDCEKYIAYRDGIETMLDMERFELMQGMNAIQFNGTGIDLNVSIRFRDKWI